MEANRVTATPITAIKTSRQEFLDADKYVPLGTATIFSGRGGVGKTTFALDYAAKVSSGRLPGKYEGKPQNVLIASHEDDPGKQLKPRLQAADMDERFIHLVSKGSYDPNQPPPSMPKLNRPHDMEQIRQLVEYFRPALLIIDPLTSGMDGDLHKVQDVRQSLDPLTALAREFNMAIIALTHTNKGGGAASDRMSGSHAFRDAARSVLLFALDEDNGATIVTLNKSNYANHTSTSFKYRLVSVDVPTDDFQFTEVAKIELLGASEISVDELWHREQNGRGDYTETQAWLRDYLIEIGGSAASSTIRKASERDGYKWRTIQAAGKKLCEIKRAGYQGQTIWTLSEFNVDDQVLE